MNAWRIDRNYTGKKGETNGIFQVKWRAEEEKKNGIHAQLRLLRKLSADFGMTERETWRRNEPDDGFRERKKSEKSGSQALHFSLVSFFSLHWTTTIKTTQSSLMWFKADKYYFTKSFHYAYINNMLIQMVDLKKREREQEKTSRRTIHQPCVQQIIISVEKPKRNRKKTIPDWILWCDLSVLSK